MPQYKEVRNLVNTIEGLRAEVERLREDQAEWRKIDTQCQETIVCPWCGHRVNEADLFEWRDGLQDCEACEGKMDIITSTTTYYWTDKPLPPNKNGKVTDG